MISELYTNFVRFIENKTINKKMNSYLWYLGKILLLLSCIYNLLITHYLMY